ncbi:hypothetical protein, partial [Photobacterium sanguinicancri]|uniref:hypothetical protein n=1 Tax=Photobacterium sanguinicancri TaxID=875932 RepID=UPI002480EE1B
QRIPNPRVGSSNLSTPAIFKALAEMLEPFSFLVFSAQQRIHRYRKSARVGRLDFSTPAIFKALAEMLAPFSFLVFSAQQRI